MTPKRAIGPFSVNPIGLGCMSLSHAYGIPPEPALGVRVIQRALDLGYDFLDTAALYGFGANETLVGDAASHRRSEFRLASKCGLTGVNGKRVVDGRPETLLKTIDESLLRLKTEVIDLYYLHRWDKTVPIEESVGALGDMVAAGKVRAIGLSEVSAATLRRAHAVHPIAAVQNEYSPWSRNVELGVLEATRELGIALVAFSPVGRGFLAGGVGPDTVFAEKDIRRAMPRFEPDNLARNAVLFEGFRKLAAEAGCTPAQLSLRWVLSRGDHVLAIPGTTSLDHLDENFAALRLAVAPEILAAVDKLFTPGVVAGGRYNEAAQRGVDTEEFTPA